MGAAANAIASYFKMPVVWLNGIAAALGIILVYFAASYLHPVVAALIGAFFLIALPFFFAGTYGIILDGNKKKGAFMIYARYGYTRCLPPAIFVAAICLLLSIVFGQIGMLISIPIVFFTYFADITAIRHNLRTGQALKDSAKRVLGGSFLVLIFYLANIIAGILMAFLFDFIFGGLLSVSGGEVIVTSVSQTLLENPSLLNPADVAANQETLVNLGNQLISSSEIMLPFVFSSAIVSFLFMPFFTAYKAFFFRDLIAAQAAAEAAMRAARAAAVRGESGNAGEAQQDGATRAPETYNPPEANPAETSREAAPPAPQKPYDPHAGEDGEYDSKGRWFKYK